MDVRLVHEIPPTKINNPRNSEGAFIRAKNGDILFAYSRYNGTSHHDNASCDIALLRSTDEGESWKYEKIIAYAKDFGVENLMSVSAIVHDDASLSFYFMIKENNKTSSLGKCTSKDGINFNSEDAVRCKFLAKSGYYVINNDRLLKLSDGRILAPAAYYPDIETSTPAVATCIVSNDDGDSFEDGNFYLESAYTINAPYGLQEPGITETDNGLYMWFRTNYGCQYESRTNGLNFDFTTPLPSIFSSPRSPMQIKRCDGVFYAIYNPIPNYNGRVIFPGTAGRSPIVIQKSVDGVKYGPVNIIESSEASRGYCYPSIFKTNDGCLLIAYCRGDELIDGDILDNTGILKIKIDTIE